MDHVNGSFSTKEPAIVLGPDGTRTCWNLERYTTNKFCFISQFKMVDRDQYQQASLFVFFFYSFSTQQNQYKSTLNINISNPDKTIPTSSITSKKKEKRT